MERELQHQPPAVAYTQQVTTVPYVHQQVYYPAAQPSAYVMPGAVAPYLHPGMGGMPLPPPEEDESRRSKVFPIHGNTTNFNINTLLYNNILQSDYFKALYQLRTYHETIGQL